MNLQIIPHSLACDLVQSVISLGQVCNPLLSIHVYLCVQTFCAAGVARSVQFRQSLFLRVLKEQPYAGGQGQESALLSVAYVQCLVHAFLSLFKVFFGFFMVF
jgi:hypothetical protein